MRIYDIICDKRDKKKLTKAQIDFFVKGVASDAFPDYQISALLMAIFLNGMDSDETSWLTSAMAFSGDTVDLSGIDGIKVDKHSTGGVGDKTTLIVAPIVASLGLKVAKMSGRGLGHTGGTIDKLEAISGFCTTLPREKFFELVNNIGISVIGQSGALAPADKKLYALRDVTGTIESIPLIASSIMSKKLASGADCILLDVKTGSGAFMKGVDDSIALAKAMVDIGESVNKSTVALITDMDVPLGYAIGNSLEIIEAVEVLKGKGPCDLVEICIELAANMLLLGKKGTLSQCRSMALEAIASGNALERFKMMVQEQGGDVSLIDDTLKFPKAKYSFELTTPRGGFIYSMDTQKCGIASVMLGAGRETKSDTIDYTAGIVLRKKTGDRVAAGESLATLYSSDQTRIQDAAELLLDSFAIANSIPAAQKLIYARVDKQGVTLDN